MAAAICGPQGLNVMSSIAISFPQPPGALFLIRNTISETDVGVVKKTPNCLQIGVGDVGTLPVVEDTNTVPSVRSMVKVTSGKMILPLQTVTALGCCTFINQAANS